MLKLQTSMRQEKWSIQFFLHLIPTPYFKTASYWNQVYIQFQHKK